MYFLSFRIFEQLALALKNRVSQKFFAVLNILFTFRIFEQLALALKNRWCPEFTILNVFFYYSGFLSNLHLLWKTEGALKFFAVLNISFIVLVFWVTCACPENRVALEFFRPGGGGRPPDPQPRTPMLDKNILIVVALRHNDNNHECCAASTKLSKDDINFHSVIGMKQILGISNIFKMLELELLHVKVKT